MELNDPVPAFAGLVQTSAPAPGDRQQSDEALFSLIERAMSAKGKGKFSQDVFTWLLQGLLDVVAAGGTRTLDDCLGMRVASGQRSIVRRFSELKRTAAVVEAWRLVSDGEEFSAWRTCEILVVELEIFARDFWPQWKHEGLPAGASRLRAALYRIFAALPSPPPRSTNGIYALLRRAGELI